MKRLTLGLAVVLAGGAMTRGGEVRTVYVPVAKSVAFRRDVNLPLTEMVQKKIDQQTPYKVVGSPGEAGATLELTMVVRQSDISLEAKLLWGDNPAPDGMPQPFATTVVERLSPDTGSNREALERLAERIVARVK